MKTFKRMCAVGIVGVLMGSSFAVFSASPAGARAYSYCDQRVSNMERSANKDYAKGKLSAEDYEKVMAEVAYHRELWGC